MCARGSVYDSTFTQPFTPNSPTMRPSRRRLSPAESIPPLSPRRAPDGSGSRLGLLGGFLHQPAHLVRHLCALGHPLVDLVGVQFQAHILARRDRVVEADALDVAAVARVALVGDDDVIERTAL